MDLTAVEELSKDHRVHYDRTLAQRPTELERLAADCDALVVRNRTQVRGSLLDSCRRLRVVGRLGVGVDNIDLEGCRARGIQVLPATGANNVAVAEYVVTTILLLLRGAYTASAQVLAGTWPREHFMGREIQGRTLGLVGFGAIARATAKRAQALGMRVVAYDPYVAADDPGWRALARRQPALGALLEESDAVSLHVPLTAETHHLINAARLAQLKPDAVLINAARGGIVNEVALADSLQQGRLGGAALDVFETEPLPASSHLVGVPNLILTPHVAGVTIEANARVSRLTADNVRRALADLQP